MSFNAIHFPGPPMKKIDRFETWKTPNINKHEINTHPKIKIGQVELLPKHKEIVLPQIPMNPHFTPHIPRPDKPRPMPKPDPATVVPPVDQAAKPIVTPDIIVNPDISEVIVPLPEEPKIDTETDDVISIYLILAALFSAGLLVAVLLF